MKCWECGFSTLKIVSKNCQDMENYKACSILRSVKIVMLMTIFINKDYYGYIDADVKPLMGNGSYKIPSRAWKIGFEFWF